MLLGDGGRDAALLHVIRWAIHDIAPSVPLQEPAVFKKHWGDLVTEIPKAAEEFAPDLLFVHRDAERIPLGERLAQIPTDGGRIVRVVPVRMTEAWLLIDESALRHAAGNPHGREPLLLPSSRRLEQVKAPKAVLAAAFLAAGGQPTGRRRSRVRRDESSWAERVASVIVDFAPLRDLSSFQAFESELQQRLDEWRASVSE